jgi:hypothetical protein
MGKSRKKRLSYQEKVDRYTAIFGVGAMLVFGAYMIIPLFIK